MDGITILSGISPDYLVNDARLTVELLRTLG